MTNKIKVSEIMTKSVIVGNVNNSFTQIMKFFTEYGIQHLPIADGDTLVGIISVNDMASFIFLQVKQGSNLHATALDALFNVKTVMTANPVTITPDDTVARVVELLADGRFQALPVTQNGKVTGIVTNKDLVRMLQWEYTH